MQNNYYDYYFRGKNETKRNQLDALYKITRVYYLVSTGGIILQIHAVKENILRKEIYINVIVRVHYFVYDIREYVYT